MRDFEDWLAGFRPSIASFDYYCDFDKCVKNAMEYRPELHLMNSLIGLDDVEGAFRELAKGYPKVIAVIPTLLAVRYREIRAQDSSGAYIFDFKKYTNTLDEYCLLMRETGLFNLISKHLVNNLFDYALGVEVGLDSNGRKNRGGHVMEDLVESFISAAGFKFAESPKKSDVGVYAKEMYLSDIEDTWGLDLGALSNEGETEKRFDFVVRTASCVYGIETNFYTGGGSKLNETARSYKTLALESDGIDGFEFVWFTDGGGWRSARKNLKETFDVMEHVYCVSDLENGICKKVFK